MRTRRPETLGVGAVAAACITAASASTAGAGALANWAAAKSLG